MSKRAKENLKNTSPELQSKICPVCHRPFNNRKRWESRGLWPSIVYCSDQCRRQKQNMTDTNK